ncbi:MAG: DEAD/DEAH box helicase family protein [Proteobacteria bacterium]|nr:DEAD/DEAH box helicase family protein [Pseudomonadota bacterium]
MTRPDFIDNRNGNTLERALKKVLGKSSRGFSETEQIPDEVRIATAYFSPEGFTKIAPALATIQTIRLMLGAEPLHDRARWQRKLEETEERFFQRKLRENLDKNEKTLREERDHLPFTRTSAAALLKLVEALKAGNMEVRRYEEGFMHAKAYIFSAANEGDYGKTEGVIVGSSNLTSSGLSTNLELNLGRYDHPVVGKAEDWFDSLWEQSQPFDLAAMFEEVFFHRKPYDIFIRVLWELYGEEVEQDADLDKNLPLTSFQKHGVHRAMRLIESCGGVIVADEVGLGKTFIAGEILTRYQERRQRALLICPASLRDSTWRNFLDEFQLYLEVISFEQLANDKQLKDARRPDANQEHLERLVDEYQLVIIDEAHNYRNPDAPFRAGALRTFLYGRRKDVLMLTATPVNNSLWDLYHLTRFFLKQDSFLANKGIISIRERFQEAMHQDPANLSPDILYPIIDATTVKRTRQFIKKHYSHDQIKDRDGNMVPIIFPEPKAITIRYNLDELLPGLFDLIETALDPDDPDCLTLARYIPEAYRLQPEEEELNHARTAIGLLRSGLLKRFESSTEAFRISLQRLISQHAKFLEALKQGYVINSAFLSELSATDDEDFEALLEDSENTSPAKEYSSEKLAKDIAADLEKLRVIKEETNKINAENDPKLKALVSELEKIIKQAEKEGIDLNDTRQKSKVLIFSFFADSVKWINAFLQKEIETNPILKPYKNRIKMVMGRKEDTDLSRAEAVSQFAPISSGSITGEDLIDVLITTDVLAEGVNLQQCRHIINYDMPWNPMRLVQRHGRIDRIGSPHSRVFMRTIFPVDRLEELLNLEGRIMSKLAMAAASVGVRSPLAGFRGGSQVFSETKEEIEKLMAEDPSLYERGGTISSVQSGEEYRQTLRKELEVGKDQIVSMPWKTGSGMAKGKERGMFFCAKVGERTYLRFVRTKDDWTSLSEPSEEEVLEGKKLWPIISELGTCLRIIECEPEQPLKITDEATDAAFDLWEVARNDIWNSWMWETDPANLQPRVRPLNHKVAEFIRNNPPLDFDQGKLESALDILEAPWPRRDENMLRQWFDEELSGQEKSKMLLGKILESGLEPLSPPDPLPPIKPEDIELLVWMAIEPDETS